MGEDTDGVSSLPSPFLEKARTRASEESLPLLTGEGQDGDIRLRAGDSSLRPFVVSEISIGLRCVGELAEP